MCLSGVKTYLMLLLELVKQCLNTAENKGCMYICASNRSAALPDCAAEALQP